MSMQNRKSYAIFYDIIQCLKIMALCIEPLGVCKKENKIRSKLL